MTVLGKMGAKYFHTYDGWHEWNGKICKAAAEMTEAKVTVIDSMFISHALSFQVLEAAKMAARGKEYEEIVDQT